MNAAQMRAADELADKRDELRAANTRADELRREHAQLVIACRQLGIPLANTAELAGVSVQRVKQLAPGRHPRAPRAAAGKKAAAPARDDHPLAVPNALGYASGPLLSDHASVRSMAPYGSPTSFLEYRPGLTLADVVGAVGRQKRVRVYLTGGLPAGDDGATLAEQTRSWALGGVPKGWRYESLHLADADLPVIRLVHDDGSRLSVMRSAAWWGETDAGARDQQQAFAAMAAGVGRAFAGAGIADTPATAGRALWQRTIGGGRSYPVLSAELRELISSTSGQGRIELLPPRGDVGPTVMHGPGVRNFTYLDGRLMYAALTWGMPIGEPTLVPHTEAPADLRGRSRWLATVEVPSDWPYPFGLLMAPDDAGGWRYPATPGERWRWWFDGSSLHHAMARGYRVQLHSGLTWREGKPLNSWTDKLVRLHADASEHGAQLAARGIRSLILHAIGAFASRAHDTTGACSIDEPGRVPDDAVKGSVTRVGELLVWQQPGKLSAWSESLAHPEWSALIWERARARVTAAAMAAHLVGVPVIAFATDALYLADDPRPAADAARLQGFDVTALDDDGKPGRFRSKGSIGEPRPWPATRDELYRLRDEAEA